MTPDQRKRPKRPAARYMKAIPLKLAQLDAIARMAKREGVTFVEFVRRAALDRAGYVEDSE